MLTYIQARAACRVAAAILAGIRHVAASSIGEKLRKKRTKSPRAYITNRPIYGPDDEQCGPRFCFIPFSMVNFMCVCVVKVGTEKPAPYIMRFEILIARTAAGIVDDGRFVVERGI